MATEFVLVHGSHDHAPESAQTRKSADEPHIEALGLGWYRVVGSHLGPFETFGLDAAKAALAQIVDGCD